MTSVAHMERKHSSCACDFVSTLAFVLGRNVWVIAKMTYFACNHSYCRFFIWYSGLDYKMVTIEKVCTLWSLFMYS